MNDQFISADGCYLLSHSVGLQPKSCSAALAETFLSPWAADPESVWPSWLGAIDGFRSELAQLLNTKIELLCPQVNLSSAFLKLLQSIPFSADKNVVLMHENDFPSMVFVVKQLQSLGLELRLIPADRDPTDSEQWLEWLRDDVALLMLTHVYSNTGQRSPVKDIAALARKRNIISVVDIAQSVGVVPIDLQSWNADFVLGSCVKWLCGGPGAGFLWVAEHQLEACRPIDVGWFSHENPFEFDIYNFRYHSSALRFWGGTPSVAPYICAANSIALHNQNGVPENYRHNQTLCDYVIDRLPSHYLASPADPEKRGGTLIINCAEKQDVFCSKMTEEHIKFDQRPQGVRVSPHIYNTLEDMKKLISCI
jgi:selenocysteine lyase/cysteine desulfurase